MSAETRKRIDVPDGLPPCRECGAEQDFVKISDVQDAAEDAVLGEVRCENGHLLMQFVKPSAAAIERGRELAAKYGWASPEEPIDG